MMYMYQKANLFVTHQNLLKFLVVLNNCRSQTKEYLKRWKAVQYLQHANKYPLNFHDI